MNRNVDAVEWDGNEKSDRKMIYRYKDGSELVFVMQALISDNGKKVGLLFRYWQAR